MTKCEGCTQLDNAISFRNETLFIMVNKYRGLFLQAWTEIQDGHDLIRLLSAYNCNES